MILVTGANGLVGSALVTRLERRDSRRVVRAVRRLPAMERQRSHWFEMGDLTANLDWGPGLCDVTTVIHTAARVHVEVGSASDSIAVFRRVNLEATLNLARQAAAMGVTRFVFLSSVKVLGEATRPQAPFQSENRPAPEGPYAVSKAEAEQGLKLIGDSTGMQIVIVRPTLVYGPGVRANFRTIMRWLARGLPLPLGGIKNLRSLVAVDNLVDLIVACVNHPRAGNQVFMASDGEDLSTPDLLCRVGRALGKPARLLAVPPAILKCGGALLGCSGAVERLCSSLQVDIEKNRRILGWTPPVNVDEGINRTVRRFLDEAN